MTTKKTTPATTKKPTGKQAAKTTATGAPEKPRKRRATPTGVTVVVPRVPGHHYGSHRHHSTLATGDVVYVGSVYRLMQLEVIEAGKKAEEMPELGKGRYVTIRTVADELEVEGSMVKNAEVTLICEADSVLAVKGRY